VFEDVDSLIGVNMKILVVHNFYTRRTPSGENEAVTTDISLLRAQGHEVVEMGLESDAALSGRPLDRMAGAAREMRRGGMDSIDAALESGFDVIHLHNPFPFLSSKGLQALKQSRAPVVMTVHNFRLSCMAGTHFRDGGTCHLCDEHRSDLPGVKYGCYRASRLQSGAMYMRRRQVIPELLSCDHYFALTTFHSEYLVERFGITPGRITVRGTPMIDSGMAEARGREGVLYVGRLSAEKGVELLLATWRKLGAAAPPLRIVGAGPLEGMVDAAIREGLRITWVGRLSQEGVLQEMRRARTLIVPSTCYEGLPRTVVEAFSTGLPVIATNLGGLRGVVDMTTGRCVGPNLNALAEAVLQLVGTVAWYYEEMCRTARSRYESEFSPPAATKGLLAGYRAAMRSAGAS
jgi:glycosyltransferase involved in cell wall biosynthesis